MNNNSSRRNFLRQLSLGTLLAIPATLTFGRIFSAHAQAPKAGAKLEMIDPKNPQAQALGYITDAAKVDTKK